MISVKILSAIFRECKDQKSTYPMQKHLAFLFEYDTP